MNTHDAFMAAIVENLDDDAPRLIYADWLEEQGDRDRAEFIRVQCEIARRGELRCAKTGKELKGYAEYEKHCRCTPCRLKQREYYSSQRFIVWEWTGRLRGPMSYVYREDFRRGFIESVTCTCQQWLYHGSAILAAQPTIREVRMSDVEPRYNHYFPEDVDGWSYDYPLIGIHFNDAVLLHRTADDARATLSRCALAFARSRQPVTA